MDSSNSNTSYDTSWSSATNWTIAGGSLENSVTFESYLSLINEDKSDNLCQSSTTDSTSKSRLILYPPSPDYSTPCEITITFAQKQRVRQVYVRSTSRVYEIYYASDLQSSGEYLCTVRCGIAVRDEEVLRATNVEEAVLAHQKGFSKELAEERLRNGSNMTASEDDWVEVKVLDTQFVNGNSSSSSNSDTSQGRSSQPQDLYEATADITDADPCTSITLKLLSLQNKGCICIEEVYVFADPVDAADVDNKVDSMENSAGNSLMAMIMPTFLQLSKQKGIGRAQDECDNDRMNEQKSEKNKAKPPDRIDSGNNIQQEEKFDSVYQKEVQLQEAITPITKPVRLETPPRVSDKESKPGGSQYHIEGVLNQLVSRVNTIEDLFLRFEDCMLKPIRSIDERLQRVEQQLEVLMKKTQNSGLLSCNRITAPEFSCSESDTNSLYNSGCVDLGYAACDANKKDLPPTGSSILSDVTPIAVDTSISHPSLVVTAPEFSNCDDEEEDDAMEPVKESPEEENDAMEPVEESPEEEDNATEPVRESPKEKRKHAMSIDDALASALAGFLTSTSIQSPKYSKTLSVKAPEFPNEEGNNSEKTVSPRDQYEIITESPNGFSEPNGRELLRSSFSSLSNISSESNKNVMRSPNNNNCGNTKEGVAEQPQHSTIDEGDSQGACIHLTVPATHDMARTGPYQIIDDIENAQIGNGTGNISALEKSDSLEQFSGNQTDGYDIFKEGAVMNELTASTEITNERSNLDILQNVVEFSHAASNVDFETSILEVTFASQETLNAKSPLEALLAGIPDLNVEAHPMQGSSEHDSQNGDQYNLIPVEDWGEMGSATDNHIPLYMNYCSLPVPALNADDTAHFL